MRRSVITSSGPWQRGDVIHMDGEDPLLVVRKPRRAGGVWEIRVRRLTVWDRRRMTAVRWLRDARWRLMAEAQDLWQRMAAIMRPGKER